MKNRFLILLSFVLIVGRDAVCANTSMVRERININRDWRYQIDDPDGVGAALHYSRLKPYLLMTLLYLGRGIRDRKAIREKI